MPSEETKRRGRVTQALLRARSVQLGMLPPPPKLEGVDIDVFYEACDELGGDFYDFVTVSPTELGIVLADVSGHGLDAALMMAAAKKTLQIHARRSSSPAEVLIAACEDLADDLPKGSFITVWYGVLNSETGLLRYASAGHNPLILRRRGSSQVSRHSAKGVVLGSVFLKAMQDGLEEQSLQLQHGDTVLLYTDGVTEAARPDDEQFGLDRLGGVVAKSETPDSGKLLADVLEELKEFCGERVWEDDVTLLGLRFLGNPAAKPAWRQKIDTNLLPRSDSFIAREEESAEIRSHIENGRRIVAIVGVAGLGKTRLALESARALGRDYPGGVWMVQLAACRDESALFNEIAANLRLTMNGSEPPAQQLGRMLGLRGPTLMVLDNAEDVIEPLREVLRRWQVLAPELVCLVTSQIRPAARGVPEIALRPLSLPAKPSSDPEVAGDYAAVKLFVDRARHANPEFALTRDNVADVLGICSELGCMPLALELAASRMHVLTPRKVLQQLRNPSSRVAVMRARSEGLASPYSSMREALEWSFGHLEEWELDAFRQLCVFAGGCYLEAVENVVQVPGRDAQQGALDAIEALLDKSFLWREATPYGTRFHAFSALSEFASQLGEPDPAPEAAKRHIAYFTTCAEEWQKRFNGPDFIEANDRLALDRANLLAAADAAIAARDIKSAASLLSAVRHISARQGGMADVLPRARAAVEACRNRDSELQASLLNVQSTALMMLGDPPEALRTARRAHKLVRDDPDSLAGAYASYTVAHLQLTLGEGDEAETDMRRAIDTLKRLGQQEQAARGHIVLGGLRVRQQRPKEALLEYEQAESLARGVDSRVNLMGVNVMRASAYIALDRLDDAWAAVDDGEKQAVRLEFPVGRIVCMRDKATILMRRGQLDDALEQLLRALQLARESGASRTAASIESDLAELSLAVGDIDAAAEHASASLDILRDMGERPLIARAARLLAETEIERREFASALKHIDEAFDALEKLENRSETGVLEALRGLALLGVDAADGAEKLVAEALRRAEAAGAGKEEYYLLLLACHARCLLALDRVTEANRVAARARELGTAHGLYTPLRLVNKALSLLEVSARGTTKIHRVRVHCAVCGQRYMGSRERIRALKKCMRCGHTPFQAADNPAGDQP
jgi:predicted ATPase